MIENSSLLHGQKCGWRNLPHFNRFFFSFERIKVQTVYSENTWLLSSGSWPHEIIKKICLLPIYAFHWVLLSEGENKYYFPMLFATLVFLQFVNKWNAFAAPSTVTWVVNCLHNVIKRIYLRNSSRPFDQSTSSSILFDFIVAVFHPGRIMKIFGHQILPNWKWSLRTKVDMKHIYALLNNSFCCFVIILMQVEKKWRKTQIPVKRYICGPVWGDIACRSNILLQSCSTDSSQTIKAQKSQFVQ